MSETSEADRNFYAAVGLLTLSWAQLEFALDAAISIIHQRFDGNAIDRVAPLQLGRKVDYLKSAVRKLPPLSEFRDRMIPIFQKIKDASELRKQIVHGVVTERSVGSLTATMVRLLHDNTGYHAQKPMTVTVPLILQAIDEVTVLAKAAFEFVQELVGKLRT